MGQYCEANFRALCMKKISICIPVFNKIAFTRNCLKDLSHLKDVEIIVVDNASSDETQKELQDNKDIVYYRCSKNMGFGAASNVAYNLSTSNNVLFLNNDIAVRSDKENWIDVLVEKIKDDVLVGPTMGQLDKDLNFIKEADAHLPGISYMSGWCLAGNKKTFNHLSINRKIPNSIDPKFESQIFDEDFFAYFEDTSLSLTARELDIGFEVVNLPLVHFKRQTSLQLNTNNLYNASRQIFLRKWQNRVKKLKLI